MSNKPDGGPAFPFLELDGAGAPYQQNPGMSLRDYFAIHASNEDVKAQAEVIRAQVFDAHGLGILPDNWHITARYMHADAMLEARES